MLKGKYFADFKRNNLNVYVIDSKVNVNHPEFGYLNQNPMDMDLGGLNERFNHGTHVAGIIVGGSIGVIRDPETRFYTYGVCKLQLINKIMQVGCPEDNIVAGLEKVLMHLNMNPKRRGVINMSIGGKCGTTFFGLITRCSKPIETAIKNIRNHKSCPIIVASAGNDGKDSCDQEPARYDEVITVGAHDVKAERWIQTPNTCSNIGDCVDTWAPGARIRSSLWTGYGENSGTSFAAPAITGLVGAWILICPSIQFDEIKARLQCSGKFKDNCDWMAKEPVVDARSTHNRRFCFDCGKVRTMFDCTKSPTCPPTDPPTGTPTASPTVSPTNTSTLAPTNLPTPTPTDSPTALPTTNPSTILIGPTGSPSFIGCPCFNDLDNTLEYCLSGCCNVGLLAKTINNIGAIEYALDESNHKCFTKINGIQQSLYQSLSEIQYYACIDELTQIASGVNCTITDTTYNSHFYGHIARFFSMIGEQNISLFHIILYIIFLLMILCWILYAIFSCIDSIRNYTFKNGKMYKHLTTNINTSDDITSSTDVNNL